MPDQKNDDLEIPHIPTEVRPFVQREFKADKVPIFWGPKQEYTGVYVEPSGWRSEFLHIPIIGRFIYCNEKTFDTDKYKHPGGGGGPTDYYFIIAILDHTPLFPHDFVIQYGVHGSMPFSADHFSTNQYVMDSLGNLVNVGALLSVGMKWVTFEPAFNYIITGGASGAGWYSNTFGTFVNFF